ncbi:hypothetical protein EIB73_08245 [Kaistella carnis]|uniref:Uncharacterized protein n=1 Tax=Kaistella carnis TaxID=1241979 RepID=A0A3G8XW52_9FLAO|nr:hypothetical protein EIB73_08245 [Kaistella carnis]
MLILGLFLFSRRRFDNC